jgi:hypothetical protein
MPWRYAIFVQSVFVFVGQTLAAGPIFYGLKVFAHVDVAPWQFFVASTATFGGALVGITYGGAVHVDSP